MSGLQGFYRCGSLLAVAMLFAVNIAQAADQPSLKAMLLMPGPLIEAHASEENDCAVCHSRFEKEAQDARCLSCHEDVGADRDSKEGFHGRSPEATQKNCSQCHKDHKGRDFNAVPLDSDTFDHDLTDFALRGSHRELKCSACHTEGEPHRETSADCVQCHEDDDPHGTALDNECGVCHSPLGWLGESHFDHDATDFPLRGKHGEAACDSCHGGEVFQFESTECVACHRISDVHAGRFGQQCDSCHIEEEWARGQFDHAANTQFALKGAHEELPCSACHHRGQDSGAERSTACSSCHGESDIHSGRHGNACENCHSTARWQLAQYDHAETAGWPLPPGHGDLTCLQCHRGSLEEDLDTRCGSCHQADNLHRSDSMAECDTCHDSRYWEKGLLFDHELTRFPLEGMHAILPCGSCHVGRRFSSADSACSECHSEEDAHGGALGDQCRTCHSPNGWNLSLFDHGKDAGLELAGAHADLSCASCHREGGESPAADCASCHGGDDRHGGQFGVDCGRCHNDRSFEGATWP